MHMFSQVFMIYMYIKAAMFLNSKMQYHYSQG